jgi:hypothetical protein
MRITLSSWAPFLFLLVFSLMFLFRAMPQPEPRRLEPGSPGPPLVPSFGQALILWAMTGGKLDLPDETDLFNLDVGWNTGKISLGWLKEYPHIFVVGVEANPLLVDYFYRFNGDATDKLLTPVYRREAQRALRPFLSRMLVVNAAASQRSGEVLELWMGTNQHDKEMTVDEGTVKTNLKVYADRAKSGTRIKVPTLRVEAILDLVPTPSEGFRWGCLKTDIQGSDFDALASSGPLIRNFACVVSEHTTHNTPHTTHNT